MAMHNRKFKHVTNRDFKIMKFGNMLINVDVEDIIKEEIEQTLFIIEHAKDINQFLEA
tara:strand:+ start:259 stop:432 length:174 start_codon:yes stop_codon:yes gene_type:complete